MSIEITSREKQFYCAYIDLLSAVINNKKPEEVPQGFNWNFFIKHAQYNSVLNILGYSINSLKNKPDATVVKVAENERRYAIIKETSQLVLVEEILYQLEKEKIKNIPLKGYYMKQMYPHSDLRTMTDVDILVDIKDLKKVKKIFLDKQFSFGEVNRFNEVHFKMDLAYFEVQTALDNGEDDYFKNIWSKVKLREDYNYSYQLSNEDFYIYMIYHIVKHFKSGGVGLRMIMDIYVYLSKNPDLNWEYIENAFKELKISKLANELKKTGINWFSQDKTEITPIGEFILYCSTFGNTNIHFYQDSVRNKKFYWLKQFFLPYSKLKNKFAYLEKAPILLPIGWMHYWYRRIFVEKNVRVKEGIKERKQNISPQDKEFIDKLSKDLEI